ncbi:MAG: CoA transferase [Actinobacteria bacterium]|nr:CoA transferase [Actinomycetota bacterium]
MNRPHGSMRGLRVVEISTSVAGPLVGQILGDLGADVVKVERVGAGDDTRAWAPPVWDEQSVIFLGLNRNKRSLELDYKDPRGAEVLERLIASADVLVQNLRPGALAKAGFAHDRLRALNPRLVHCDMSGFGPQGPRKDDPAYDPLLQAYSGIVDMVSSGDGPPVRVPLSVLDKGTGMWAVIGILDALRRRDQTGEGSHVEVSLLQTALSWVNAGLMSARAGNQPRERLGSGHDGVVPYGAFPVSDGYVFLSAGNQVLWTRFCRATGAEDLLGREGFASNPERSANRRTVEAAVGDVTSRFDAATLLALLADAGVPASRVNKVEDMAHDEQALATGMLERLPHPIVADLEVVNLPMTFDGQYPAHTCAPPLLGADTRAVLADLGYDEAGIDALLSSDVVAATSAARTEEAP